MRIGPRASERTLDWISSIGNAGGGGEVQHFTRNPDEPGGVSPQRADALLPKALRAGVTRYRWWIVLTTLVVVGLVTLWTFRSPRIYQAVTTLEYDPNPTTPLGSSVEDVSSDVSHFLMSKEFFETQNLIIQSRAVAERVVEHLGLADDPEFFGQEEGPEWSPVPMPVAAQYLQSKLVVDPVKDTRLIEVKVRDADPERAATLANAVADAYIEKTMEDRLGSTAAAAEWLAQQLDSTRKQLSESENALHDFKRQHNVLSVSLEDRQNLLAEEIRKYNERLTDARARRIELQARVDRLKSARDNPDAIRDDISQEDSELESLRSRLREKLTERAALSIRYGDSHPAIRELDGEIAALRESLALQVDALVETAEGDLREAHAIESGLSKAQEQAKKAGLDLNLREIEYSRLNRQRESNGKLYDLLLQRTAETDLTGLLRTTHVRVVDRALVPKSAVSPVVGLNIAGGLLTGLVLGFGLALLLQQMDRRIQDVSDVEELGLTILGVFPRVDDSSGEAYQTKGRDRRRRRKEIDAQDIAQILESHPMSAVAESCRALRTNLTFVSAESPLNTLVVTSANPRDGKTTVASNIAIAFAQSGQRVLLIDADLRRPRLHRTFNINDEAGLTSTLVAERTLAEVTHPVGIDNLWFVPCGPIPPNPAELLHTRQFAGLLDEATSRYDRVIFDSPPLRAVTDAAILAPQCAGTLLVVRARATTRDAVALAIRSLRDVRAQVVGGVLNDVERGGGLGRGDGYYDYYRNEEHRSQRGSTLDRDRSQSAA